MNISYLSLGWGIQSTTLAAMMALDEIPRVDYVVHADTTHERAETLSLIHISEPTRPY